jgi:hypothetical protein
VKVEPVEKFAPSASKTIEVIAAVFLHNPTIASVPPPAAPPLIKQDLKVVVLE